MAEILIFRIPSSCTQYTCFVKIDYYTCKMNYNLHYTCNFNVIYENTLQNTQQGSSKQEHGIRILYL
jgi:hypothetical protein